MAPTPDHIALRQLIRTLASTPNGYTTADAHGMPGAAYSSQHTNWLIAAGELLQVKVPGHFLHFVRTQAQADALTAVLLAGEKKRIRHWTPKPVNDRPRPTRASPLRLWIQSSAATPAGVTLADCAHLVNGPNAFSKCVQNMSQAGTLFHAKVRGWPYRYFSTQAAADQWTAATPERTVPRKVRIRPAKPPKPIVHKPAKSAATLASPLAPGAPHKDAVTVYPEHYRKTVTVMAQPRNQVVTVGFVHNGYGVMR